MENIFIIIAVIIISILIYKTTKNKATYTPTDENIKITNVELMTDLVMLVNYKLTKEIKVNGALMRGDENDLSEKKVEYLYNKLKELSSTKEIYISSEFSPYITEVLESKNYE